MESSDGFTAVEAARLAREVDERARSGLRSYAQLTMWAAVFMSAYLSVWVTTVAARPDSGVQPVFMMLPVVLIYSSLIAGARERFAIHLRTRPVDLVAGAIALMLAGVVVGVGLFGPEIPVWVGVAVGVTALILLGARPVRILMTSPRTRDMQPTSAPVPLSRSSRWMTVVVGVLLGVPVAAAPVPALSAVTMLVVMVPVMVSLLVTRSRFRFQLLGRQWGTWQWAGYGTSATIIFGYAACIAFGVGASLPVGVTVSAFVAAATAVTALAPASQR